MLLSAGKNLSIRVTQSPEKGTPWIVRLERRRIFGSKVESSDWFLDEAQARRFAELLARDLRAGASIDVIRNRKPGWTLHPAPQRG